MLQMIKGINVELYTGAAAETVENVLIGEPSGTETLSYTLGIPKGDDHNWLDKKVRFFGEFFRTVGRPEQGVEENIPLFWNKKIRAELMNISGSCTIYEKNTFARHVFKDVFFCDKRGEKDTKTGSRKDGSLSVTIYSASDNITGYSPKIGDCLICCESDFEFDTSSQKAVSESLAEFRRLYSEYAVIKSVDRKLCGALPDHNITAE